MARSRSRGAGPFCVSGVPTKKFAQPGASTLPFSPGSLVDLSTVSLTGGLGVSLQPLLFELV